MKASDLQIVTALISQRESLKAMVEYASIAQDVNISCKFDLDSAHHTVRRECPASTRVVLTKEELRSWAQGRLDAVETMLAGKGVTL